jgi:DNA-binding NarL/FixJ family response regulator
MSEPTQENRIRLVLVDDQLLFRASLGRFLAMQPGFELAGECGTAAEALEILHDSSVDIILLDLDVSLEGGENLISTARCAGYKGYFLVVAGTADARELSTAIKLGASGVFLKSAALDRLVQAIRLVASGAVWVDQKVLQRLADRLGDGADRTALSRMTDREREVLLGIQEGLTNRKIGEHAGLSESAVKGIVRQLFLRTGVHRREQLVRVAMEQHQ